jgi:transposase
LPRRNVSAGCVCCKHGGTLSAAYRLPKGINNRIKVMNWIAYGVRAIDFFSHKIEAAFFRNS